MKKLCFLIFIIIAISSNVYSLNLRIFLLESDTCSISIIQGDSLISNSFSQIPLSVSNNNASIYKWSPSNGISDTSISNPILSVGNDMIYTVEAYFLIDTNLVFNGDFELGNVGFQTDYTINTFQTFAYANYNIVTNAWTLNPGFASCNNGGNYMAADGAVTQHTFFYKQDVVVEPNTYYQFSVDCLNICATSTPIQNPILQFQINTQPIGSDLTLLYNNCNWYEFKELWYSGANTIASIRMIDLNTIPGANDFAIDNIALKKLCKAVDSISIKVVNPIIDTININVCDNKYPIDYYDNTYYFPGWYHYLFKTNDLIDSIHVLNIQSLSTYNIDIYDTICPGENYELNGFNVNASGKYTLEKQSIDGCDSIINLYLELYNTSDTIIDAVICQGQVYNDFGFNVWEGGVYETYYNFGGECLSKITLNLEVISDIHLPNFPEDSISAEKYPIRLDASCSGCLSYKWNTGSTSPILDVYHKGVYVVCVESICGTVCDTVLITNPDVDIFMPNSFTPLESNNISFGINTQREKIILLSFEIYNRWGEKIFETSDINKEWDGYYKGGLCMNGAYIWRILYKTIYTGNLVFEKKGVVNLIK